MDTSRGFFEISATAFDELLNDYPDVVPSKLHSLDKQRYGTIPSSVKRQKQPASLSKEQVATLVDWKLSHGKFRPSLKGLVQQNSEQSVAETTLAGFQAFDGCNDSAKASLNVLTKLKGIGPATASLLLSVYDPERVPFFSDELSRWCFYEDGKGKGWDREIKYNLKEYLQLFEKVQELRERFLADYKREIAAMEVEKVAYVLGRRGIGAVLEGTAEADGGTLKRGIAPEDDVDAKAPANKASKRNANPEKAIQAPTKTIASFSASKRKLGKH